MSEGTHNPEHPEQTQHAQTQHAEQQSAQDRAKAAAESGQEREGPSLATVALVGAGVAIIEPELIPGLLIGAGVVLVPKLLSALTDMVQARFKGVVKAEYSAGIQVRETAAEVSEQVGDVAESRAEERGRQRVGAAEEHPDKKSATRRQRRPQRSTAPASNL
jgi:hypothetical protein